MTTYLVCWVVLTLLTGLTWGLSDVHLGRWSIAVALTIALIKASLVVMFFMHLRREPAPTRLVMATALTLLVVFGAITMSELWTRFPLARP